MIELQNVTKRYGDQTVVDRVSFRVAPGETLVLLGGSGSGKTTTMKMINRLIDPDSGTITVGGKRIASIAPHELRRQIGYVIQRLGLFPHLTVAENVGITPRLLGWEAGRIRARVESLLELVELEPALISARLPHELSGGQAQRVAVARALAAEPPVLLLDEPFGALDPLTRERLQLSFCRIREQLGLTVVFVTHDMVEALVVGDRVAVMREGRLLQIGSVTELAANPVDSYVSELISAPLRQAALVTSRIGGYGA